MCEQQLSNYFKHIFYPWYQENVTRTIMQTNHPLYNFQIQTRYNLTVDRAITLMFRIVELREHAVDLLIITNIYMRKLMTNIVKIYNIDFVYTNTNVTTVFFICLLLSSKYCMDDPLKNKEIHKLAYHNQITLSSFNFLEIYIIELLDYDLYVYSEEYYLYEKIINM